MIYSLVKRLLIVVTKVYNENIYWNYSLVHSARPMLANCHINDLSFSTYMADPASFSNFGIYP